jgi:hypothetical protein
MAFIPPKGVVPFPFWNAYTPTLPEIYWDVDSHEERIKKICLLLHKLVEYADYLGENINLDHKTIEELQEQFQKFIDGEFTEYYERKIYEWIQDNIERLISAGIKQVYFGLTDDGYFCAYIPESWSEITFDTGAVYGRSDYGRLILKFEPDPSAQGVIDNTYTNYTLNARQQTIQQLIADLEVTVRRGDATYNAMFTNLDTEVSNGNF